MERIQCVGDILKGGQDRGPVLFGGLRIGCPGGPFLVQQSSALENRLGQPPAKVQKPVPLENIWPASSAIVPASAAQRNIRQAVGDRDANLGAGGVKALLGLAHVRALGDELRGKAHGQCLRQLQAGKLELLGWAWLGKLPERAAKRSRCWASCLSSGGSIAATCAS